MSVSDGSEWILMVFWCVSLCLFPHALPEYDPAWSDPLVNILEIRHLLGQLLDSVSDLESSIDACIFIAGFPKFRNFLK